MDADTAAEPLAQRMRLPPGDHRERRALIGPHLVVSLRRAARPRAQDDPVQDRLPGNRGNLDDARIAEKLGKVSPNGAGVRGIGRAEVDKQDTDLRLGQDGRREGSCDSHRFEWQRAQPLARAGEEGIGDGGREDSRSETADAAGRLAARDDLDVDVRGIADARQR